MSIATWYLIALKGWQLWTTRRRSRTFLAGFWNAPDLPAVEATLRNKPAHDPFSALAVTGFAAVRQHRASGPNRLIEAGTADEFLARSLRRSIEGSAAAFESGLAVLASVGSAAPFVGLFGTVWGIYHALLAIGIAGQGTLDKVAGPVGEALVMTAIGLAVAIPAVLAYNAFVRANRIALEALDAFAHEFYDYLATGSDAGRDATRPADTSSRVVDLSTRQPTGSNATNANPALVTSR
jgi:biopolymer transport protein ExbB